MPNTYFRDLSKELFVCDLLQTGVICAIGEHRWRIKRDPIDGMVCETTDFGVIKDYLKCHPISLDGKSFSMKFGSKQYTVDIVKSLYTKVDINSDQTLVQARLFEFGVNAHMMEPCPLRAIVFFKRNVVTPCFPFYFSSQAIPDEQLCCSVNSPSCTWVLKNGVKFSFKNRTFLNYNHKQKCGETEQYLVVESIEGIGYKEFKTSVRSILSVFGFITGHYYFGPFSVFNATTHDFIGYSDSMSKGGAARYKMFSLNPYEYYADADKMADIGKDIEGKLNPVTRRQLEKLMVLLDNEFFSHLFYVFQDLIINGSTLMASTKLLVYATCLEMCRNWWKDHYKDSLKKEKTLLYTETERDDIYNKIVTILDGDYADNPDTDICKKKIRNIFQAANQDMLTGAFEDVGVELSKEEKNSFGLRNNLLHGWNIIKSPFDEENIEKYVDEVENRCFLFHALIWRFIMKSIGYEGMYIDVATRDKLFRSSGSNNSLPLGRKV